MPQNQRRLAKNDALVELIQTTEYLDDVPTWGHRDYRLYPPQYGEIRPPREEARIDTDHTHNKGVQVPSSHSELSSPDNNIIDSCIARPHIPDIMPQLDGPASVCARRR